MSTLTLDRHIVSAPGIKGGRPCIVGRRIAVADVAVWHERLGMSVDEICDAYDLTLAEVHAALAYYFDHKADIDKRLADGAAFIAEMRAKTPSLLQRKLKVQAGGG